MVDRVVLKAMLIQAPKEQLFWQRLRRRRSTYTAIGALIDGCGS
jgi:hypothetical protein